MESVPDPSVPEAKDPKDPEVAVSSGSGLGLGYSEARGGKLGDRPWKMNGWNLQPSPILFKENELHQTSMDLCSSR